MKSSSTIFFTALLLLIPALLAGNTASAASFPRNLTLGSRGPDVTALQRVLIQKGYLRSKATGQFSALTKAALAAWQKAAGVTPSGYFGPLSRAKIAASPGPQKSVLKSAVALGAPVRVQIPKIGVDAAIQANGLTADGALDAPKNIFDVGWYDKSSFPGAKGSAILTGHVAQIRGGIVTRQGVFYDLGSLRKGDVILVTNDKGQTLRFIVRESRVYDPSAPTTEVFRTDGFHLNLITCEGTWDPNQRSYSNRLVIFTDLAS